MGNVPVVSSGHNPAVGVQVTASHHPAPPVPGHSAPGYHPAGPPPARTLPSKLGSSIPGPGRSIIAGSKEAPKRGRGQLKPSVSPGTRIPICASCQIPIRWEVVKNEGLTNSDVSSISGVLSLWRWTRHGVSSILTAATVSATDLYKRSDLSKNKDNCTVKCASNSTWHHFVRSVTHGSKGLVFKSSVDVLPHFCVLLHRTVYWLWTSSGIRHVLHVVIAKIHLVTTVSIWKTVSHTVKRTGTTCSQQNASHVASLSKVSKTRQSNFGIW